MPENVKFHEFSREHHGNFTAVEVLPSLGILMHETPEDKHAIHTWVQLLQQSCPALHARTTTSKEAHRPEQTTSSLLATRTEL